MLYGLGRYIPLKTSCSECMPQCVGVDVFLPDTENKKQLADNPHAFRREKGFKASKYLSEAFTAVYARRSGCSTLGLATPLHGFLMIKSLRQAVSKIS